MSGGFRVVSDTLVLSRVSIAVLTRDIDTAILSVFPSVRPSVCFSVTFRYRIETA